MSADKSLVAASMSFDVDKIELIKRTICKGATNDELQMFLSTATRLQLDPMAKQIWAVKRWDSTLKALVMAVQISIDGFRTIADRTKHYSPGGKTRYTYDGKSLVSATVTIKKLVRSEWHEVEEEAFLEEHQQLTKEGNPNAMWAKMPRTMLAKCAEARALRRAFPADLSGVYVPEEIGDGEYGIETVTDAARMNDALAYIAAAENIEALTAADFTASMKLLPDSQVSAVREAWSKRRESFLPKQDKRPTTKQKELVEPTAESATNADANT